MSIIVNMLVLIALLVLTIAMLVFWCYKLFFMLVMFYGAVFVPSADDKLESMLSLARPVSTDRILDLGAGDGKVVLALAQQGFSATGMELNPWLVRRARARAKRLGLSKQAHFIRQNFWQIDVSGYNLVFVYGISYIMQRLERKLLDELPSGARVISNYYQFPNWVEEAEQNGVRRYRKR